MRNGYLDFYGKHGISPVHQDISDMENFIRKRRNLYRQLGIPWQSLKGREILEFGPGGGFNALALLLAGVTHIDLVEPNETGRNEIVKLFEERGIEKNRYAIYPNMMENFKTDKKYDFVIAEQFVMHLDNWKECLEVLKKYTADNGIVITTCSDEICFYVERMKRLVAHYWCRNIEGYEAKRDFLITIFEPQLKNFGVSTRPAKDWVEDQIFNELSICDHLMNLKEAIEEFETEFDVLGASQHIFTDHSWYKDTGYDYLAEYKMQYDRKKHMFLLAGIYEESVRSIEENQKLEDACKKANDLARKYEQDRIFDLRTVKEALDEVSAAAQNDTITEFHDQTMAILELLDQGEEVDLSIYETWCKCFGKSSQYISFEKR